MINHTIIFRHDTLENYKMANTIPVEGEIVIIDYPNGKYSVRVGDGHSRVWECKKMKKFPRWIKITGFKICAHYTEYKR